VDLVIDGRTDYCIILGKNASPSEHWAASELKQFIYEMSGALLPYCADSSTPPAHAIMIGESDASLSVPGKTSYNVGPEGFLIRANAGRMVIVGSRERGTMYGVHAFLEKLGCRFLTETVNKVPKMATITVPDMEVVETPAFEYRDVFIREALNPTYAARNRSNSAHANLDTEHGGGLLYYPFVHTFNLLVPVDKYWDTHPEYFSMVDGKRCKDQLCLTNPDVLRISTQTVLGWMHDHPEAKIYSVSQNDCYNNCQCPECKKIEEEEGSPSGLMLRFVNAIVAETAKVYPDKLVDTLAYQWTEKPPKITKPAANVRVRLCPIFCCEAHPYETCSDDANKAFMANLAAWSRITDNLYIWHYNTSFANYLNPFPDFRQLMDTAKLYKRSGVKGIFWEGSYPSGGGGELAQLRAYLLAKMSWNPDTDGETVMREFCDDYYGKAGKYIYDYVAMLEDKVTKDNIHVKIWAGPNDAFLTPEIMAEADTLFDKAEAAADSPETLDRVKQARLSIEFVKLMKPILNKQTKGKEAQLLRQLDDFTAQCRHYGMTHISEGEALDHYYERVKKEIGG